VVGSLAYDSIETPYGRVARTLGGSANYFSVSASIFSPVRIVGVVGEDYEEQSKEILKKRPIDLQGLSVAKGKTFHWSGAYHGDMNEAQTKATELNVFEHFNPELPAAYKNSKFVFLANIQPTLQQRVLNQVQKPLFVGMDTMNLWIQNSLPDLKKVLAKVNALLINEKEAILLTKSRNAIEGAKKIVEMGPEVVVIKRGEYGFVLFHKTEGYFMLPAFPVEKVVDPTGAGDTFAGGFFGYLASKDQVPTIATLKKACLYGTVMASFTIQDFGLGRLANISQADVETRLKEYQACTSH
jgi:sugar/nucleoside kinase (ribokinase family)